MAIASSSADMAPLSRAAVCQATSVPLFSDIVAVAEEVVEKGDKVAAPRWTALENWAVFNAGMQAADAAQKNL